MGEGGVRVGRRFVTAFTIPLVFRLARTVLVVDASPMTRCAWARNELSIRYHDEEWGVPVHDDRVWFEFLIILEGAQAGLSWDTILRKRERYREVFARFDPAKVATFGAREVRSLLADPGIVRNRLKIAATIQNAKSFLAVQQEFGSFDAYIWRFTGGQPRVNHRRSVKDLPARSPESDALSKDLPPTRI